LFTYYYTETNGHGGVGALLVLPPLVTINVI